MKSIAETLMVETIFLFNSYQNIITSATIFNTCGKLFGYMIVQSLLEFSKSKFPVLDGQVIPCKKSLKG